MKVSKFFVIILNLCLLGNNIGDLNVSWIAGGFVLLAVGVFGVWSALKESAFMMNLYTTILSLTLILHIVAATTSNELSGQLDYIVSHSVQDLMLQYGHNPEYSKIMDSIQKEHRCCGYHGPSDWLGQQTTKQTTKHTTKRAITTDYELLDDEVDFSIDDRLKLSPPTSCCTSAKKCKNYHSRGCFKVLHKEIARIVFIVKTVAMITSVLQIFAILAAYIFGKTLLV